MSRLHCVQRNMTLLHVLLNGLYFSVHSWRGRKHTIFTVCPMPSSEYVQNMLWRKGRKWIHWSSMGKILPFLWEKRIMPGILICVNSCGKHLLILGPHLHHHPNEGWKSITSRMDKIIVIYSYDGILLSNNKQWTTHTCNNMDGFQKHYPKWLSEKRQTQQITFCMVPFT